jgi:hypothetical protein
LPGWLGTLSTSRTRMTRPLDWLVPRNNSRDSAGGKNYGRTEKRGQSFIASPDMHHTGICARVSVAIFGEVSGATVAAALHDDEDCAARENAFELFARWL